MLDIDKDRRYEVIALKMGIGDRLKEERKRLKIAQSSIMERLGTTKKTIINWENGQSSPSADQIVLLERLGYDISYVLIGVRLVPIVNQDLSRQEEVLLGHYRSAPDALKNAALGVLLSANQPQPQGLTQTANASGVMIGGYNTGAVNNDPEGRKRK